jgi:uncharacterized protein with GYD domain
LITEHADAGLSRAIENGAEEGGNCMLTYVSFFELTPEGREKFPEMPVFFEKITKIVEKEQGVIDNFYALMGPWDFFAITKFPENETAFRALGKIGALEYLKTETYPTEEVELFFKALV